LALSSTAFVLQLLAVLSSRYLLQPILHRVAHARAREVFTAPLAYLAQRLTVAHTDSDHTSGEEPERAPVVLSCLRPQGLPLSGRSTGRRLFGSRWTMWRPNA